MRLREQSHALVAEGRARASLLIAQGLNLADVSRQLGHASPDITLRLYSHLLDHAEHGQRASAALEAAFRPLRAGRA